MPIYYNYCNYVFKNGNKKGEVCEKICKEDLCKSHKNKTIEKKKEYYNNHKTLNENTYDYLIERCKNNIKNGKKVTRANYECKLSNSILDKNFLVKRKYGIYIYQNKIDEKDIIMNNKKMITLLIKLMKLFNNTNIDNKELDDYDVTEQDLMNKELKLEAYHNYINNDKYSHFLYFLTSNDRLYCHSVFNKNIYIKYQGKKDCIKKELDKIEQEIIHLTKLIKTYKEIIKLFDQ